MDGDGRMDLDDYGTFREIDSSGLITQIERMPDLLYQAFQYGSKQPLPAWRGVTQVVFAGTGSPVLGAELMAAWAQRSCLIPLTIHRNYELPAWAGGPGVLVVVCSFSGEEEESLAIFTQAVERQCRILVLTTGGKLGSLARQAGAPAWIYPHQGPVMTGMGWFYGLPLSALVQLGFLGDPEKELQAAVSDLQRQQKRIGVSIPVVQNPAKRLAGQLIGRLVAVFGADELAPVARHVKNQLTLMPKAWSQFETIPEADNNSLAGSLNPEKDLGRLVAIFITAASNQPRNQIRMDLTRSSLMLEGIGTDFYRAAGDTVLSQQWTAIHFGDYLAYYLSMAYGVDPATASAIEAFDRTLQQY